MNRLIFLLGLVMQLFLGSAYSASVVTSSSGIAADGTAATLPATNLPTASSSALGIVQCGSGTSCTAGVLSVSGSGGAGPVMLYSQTSTGVTSIPLTSLINSSYSSYQLTISGYVPSTSGTPLFMQFSQNNGSTWDSSNIYRVACFFALSNSTDGFCSSVGLGTSFDINGGPATVGGGTGACPLWLTNLSSTAVYKMVTGTCATTGGGPIVSFAVNAMEYESTSAVNAIQIFVTTGTMTVTVQLYGYP